MSAISSLAAVLGISSTGEPVTAALAELDPKTYLDVPGTMRAFQYFPEQISDNKGAEWSRRSVPGGSHPIVQFINGGERTVSFTAIFTQDENPESSLFSFDFSLLSLIGGPPKHTVDVAAAIAWLRSFTYPDYDKTTGSAKAPPLAILYLPNSGIVGASQFLNSIVAAMTSCNVVYEAFHRNGTPRIAAVSLEFVEVIQTSQHWRFQGRRDIPGLDGNPKDYFPTYVRPVIGEKGEEVDTFGE